MGYVAYTLRYRYYPKSSTLELGKSYLTNTLHSKVLRSEEVALAVSVGAPQDSKDAHEAAADLERGNVVLLTSGMHAWQTLFRK